MGQPFLFRFLFFNLSVSFILVFLFLLIFVLHKRKQIYNEIKTNKSIYILLFLIFLFASFIRFHGVVSQEFITADHLDSIHYANYILENNWDGYLPGPDSFSYPIVISFFKPFFESYYGISVGSFVSALFGSLNVIMIFIYVFILSKKRNIALLASSILSFSISDIHTSIGSYPIETSIFFIFLVLLFFEIYLKTKNKFAFLITLFSLTLVLQFYYIEFVLLALIIFRIFQYYNYRLKQVISFITKKQNLILFLYPLLVLILFISIQHLFSIESHFQTPFVVEGEKEDFVCYFAKNYCLDYNLKNAFSDGYENNGPLNSHKGHFLQYLTYEFLGEGFKFHQFFEPHLIDHNFIVEGKIIEYRNLIISLIILFALIFNKYLKNYYFLLFYMLLFILAISPYNAALNIYTSYFHVVGWITLAVLSIGFLIDKLKISVKFKPILFFLIFLFMITPFFTNHMISKLDVYSIKRNTIDENIESILILGDDITFSNCPDVIKLESSINSLKKNKSVYYDIKTLYLDDFYINESLIFTFSDYFSPRGILQLSFLKNSQNQNNLKLPVNNSTNFKNGIAMVFLTGREFYYSDKISCQNTSLQDINHSDFSIYNIDIKQFLISLSSFKTYFNNNGLDFVLILPPNPYLDGELALERINNCEFISSKDYFKIHELYLNLSKEWAFNNSVKILDLDKDFKKNMNSSFDFFDNYLVDDKKISYEGSKVCTDSFINFLDENLN